MISLYPGRFQPFHAGHAAMVQTLLDEGKEVVVGLRDTPIADTDPYTIEERTAMIHERFPDVKVITLPNIGEIVYGRGVGYRIRKIHLTPELEAISATKIRSGL